MSRPSPHTRRERADRLRPLLDDLVQQSSLREAVKITGVKMGAIRSLLEGRTPQEGTLMALEMWADRENGDIPIEVQVESHIPPGAWRSKEEMGRMIREIRERRNMSQQQLAEHLGMPHGQADISRWERGVAPARLDKLPAIAQLVDRGVEIFQRGREFDLDRDLNAAQNIFYNPQRSVDQMRGHARARRPPIVQGLSVDRREPDLPDVSFLKPRAREIYDRAVGSYLTRHWPAPVIEQAAWDLIKYIEGANIYRSSGPGKPDLNEEEQVQVIEKAREKVEKAYGPNGVVRRY